MSKVCLCGNETKRGTMATTTSGMGVGWGGRMRVDSLFIKVDTALGLFQLS
jgi:hypothetical protein